MNKPSNKEKNSEKYNSLKIKEENSKKKIITSKEKQKNQTLNILEIFEEIIE